MKMSDEKIDKLFEGMSRATARKVANQNSPKETKIGKKTPSKKEIKGKK